MVSSGVHHLFLLMDGSDRGNAFFLASSPRTMRDDAAWKVVVSPAYDSDRTMRPQMRLSQMS